MLNKNKFILGAAAAFALGVAACGEPDPTRAEQKREYTQLQREQARTYAIWQNCGIRAHEGERPGTLGYIYAQQNKCKEEYREFDEAFMRRQNWEQTH